MKMHQIKCLIFFLVEMHRFPSAGTDVIIGNSWVIGEWGMIAFY
jgi:hypothetical protein